jgi:ribosome hibernation promoting factor
MAIDISGVPIDTALRARVTRQLTRMLARVPGEPVATQVTFVDVNGPKGGRDLRCAITVRMPRRRAAHAEHVDETERQAFDGAFEALERRLLDTLERGRDLRRRPKKYFVAKQLLAGMTPEEAAT